MWLTVSYFLHCVYSGYVVYRTLPLFMQFVQIGNLKLFSFQVFATLVFITDTSFIKSIYSVIVGSLTNWQRRDVQLTSSACCSCFYKNCFFVHILQISFFSAVRLRLCQGLCLSCLLRLLKTITSTNTKMHSFLKWTVKAHINVPPEMHLI